MPEPINYGKNIIRPEDTEPEREILTIIEVIDTLIFCNIVEEYLITSNIRIFDEEGNFEYYRYYYKIIVKKSIACPTYFNVIGAIQWRLLASNVKLFNQDNLDNNILISVFDITADLSSVFNPAKKDKNSVIIYTNLE